MKRPDDQVTRALASYRRLALVNARPQPHDVVTVLRARVLSNRIVRWLDGATPRQVDAYYAGVCEIRYGKP